MTAHVEKISSDLASDINGLVTSSCERWLEINGRVGISGGMKSKCTSNSPETSASPATPNSMASRVEPKISIHSNTEKL